MRRKHKDCVRQWVPSNIVMGPSDGMGTPAVVWASQTLWLRQQHIKAQYLRRSRYRNERLSGTALCVFSLCFCVSFCSIFDKCIMQQEHCVLSWSLETWIVSLRATVFWKAHVV